MEVLHDDTDEHVEDEEADDEEEGDEVEDEPLVVVTDWLQRDKNKRQCNKGLTKFPEMCLTAMNGH